MKKVKLKELIKEIIIEESGVFSNDAIEEVMWNSRDMHNDVKAAIKAIDKFVSKLVMYASSDKGKDAKSKINKATTKEFLKKIIDRTVNRSAL